MNKSFRIFIGYTNQKHNIILSYLQKIARKKQWIFKNNLKIFDFCKKFSPKNQKETSVGQILSVLSDEISKWRNLSDYRTMRYLFFARTAFFRRGVFSHARVRACGHMRARKHLCNACAFIMGARRTEFQLSAFYDSFAELFYPASFIKSKIAEFSWENSAEACKIR